ncbi:MAG: DotG/IcmE/VirB10 family protein [Pseudomonadota bacterium]
MAAQQQGLLQSWQVQPSGVTVVVEQDLVPEPEAPATVGANGQAGGGPSPALQDVLARAGDVVLATNIIANDSDPPGPVVAEIRRGPLNGTRLVGGFQPNQNNTHLIVRFNAAVLTDGTQIPVSAYAVDARQQSLAVRTDLCRRLFERYDPRVAAAFVSGLGDALSDPGSTVVDLGGGIGTSRPEATFEQGLYSGLAQVGNDLAGGFVRSAPQGPLISLRSRQIIGVLFTQNVERP